MPSKGTIQKSWNTLVLLFRALLMLFLQHNVGLIYKKNDKKMLLKNNIHLQR